MTRLMIATAAAIAAIGAGRADARPRYIHSHPSLATARGPMPAPTHGFYPEQVEGGVTGNLAFNNQIRKLTDGLNANGAGR